MKTAQQDFNELCEAVLPKGAPEIQRQETERAFFAGYASALFKLTRQISMLPDNDAEKALENMERECQDYFRLLKQSNINPKQN